MRKLLLFLTFAIQGCATTAMLPVHSLSDYHGTDGRAIGLYEYHAGARDNIVASNRTWLKSGQQIISSYDLPDLHQRVVRVSAVFTNRADASIQFTPKTVSGSIGVGRFSGKGQKFVWEFERDKFNIPQGDYEFVIQVQLADIPIPSANHSLYEMVLPKQTVVIECPAASANDRGIRVVKGVDVATKTESEIFTDDVITGVESAGATKPVANCADLTAGLTASRFQLLRAGTVASYPLPDIIAQASENQKKNEIARKHNKAANTGNTFLAIIGALGIGALVAIAVLNAASK